MEHDALACHPERVTPAPDLAVERHEGAGEPPLGRFVYDKIRDEDGRTVLCEVVVFGLKVKRRLKSGLEAGERELRWPAPPDAEALTGEEGLRPLNPGVGGSEVARVMQLS